eukprot:scaffold277338_cov29-Tisochrysis_lutea.AAC.2
MPESRARGEGGGGAGGQTPRLYSTCSPLPSSLLRIGGRGTGALRSIGAWNAVEPYTQAVVGRKDWAPGAGVDGGVMTVRKDRPPTYVIARDRLVSCLLKVATEDLGISVRHEVDVTNIRWDGDTSAVLECRDCSLACQTEPIEGDKASLGGVVPADPDGSDLGEAFEIKADFVVASDGARRTIAEAIEADDARRRFAVPGSRFRVRKFADTSVRVYKTVPFRPPDDWRCDINYSARTKAANFDALPALDGTYCGVLLVKPDDQLTLGLDNVSPALICCDRVAVNLLSSCR